MRPDALRAPRTPKSASMQPNAIVADEVAGALKRHGVDVIFGQSIPSSLLLAAGDIGIRQLVYRTENAGAAMADGYARISRRIGVVTAQNGPAATLLVAPLAEALKSSVPLLAIVQDVPRPIVERNAFQELDHLTLFTGSAKWIRRVERRDRVSDLLDQAIVAATTGRPGPAVLILPMDLLMEEAAPPPNSRSQALGYFPLDRVTADEDAVEQAARLLAGAKRPVAIAGGGVHLSGAHDELAKLQQLASLPVGTTVMGKGTVDEAHPLSLGVIGNMMGKRGMARHSRDLIKDADVVLLVATRTAQNGTDSWSLYAPDAKFIHIDIDGTEVGRNYEAVRLVGDAKATLQALNLALYSQDLAQRTEQRAGVERQIADSRSRHVDEVRDVNSSDRSPIRPERIMADTDKVLTAGSIVTADASFSSIWIANYLQARGPGARFLTPRGLAGLGWGLPLAMGAKVARPDSPVLSFVGDGGFGHVWSELETLVRERVNVVLTVLNNQVLGFQKDAEDERHGRHTDACYFAPVDHAMVARAAGCASVRIERAADYADALSEALRRDGPTLLDVVTDPDAYPPLSVFDDRVDAVRAARARHSS